MLNEYSRLEILIGKENIEKLKKSSVCIFGLGGVGGYVVEAIARSGIGEITLIDSDTITLTNLNRQIIANHDTIDKYKTEEFKKRIETINPDIKVNIHTVFATNENIPSLISENTSYIVDAIDTVKTKLDLVQYANEKQIKIISSMGTGNKLNPCMLEVADINKTEMCPLAKVIRKELKKRGIKKLKVVYSKEQPIKPLELKEEKCKAGSTAFVPSVAGLIIASEVIKDLIDIKR